MNLRHRDQLHGQSNIMKYHLPALCCAVLSLGTPSVSSARVVSSAVRVSSAGVVSSADEVPLAADKTSIAAQAVNGLGLDLLAKATDANSNALLSPYSIQTAMEMAYAGADGDTRTQMAKVLHYPQDERALHQSFGALQELLATGMLTGEITSSYVGPSYVELTVANRLFGQRGYEFRQPFPDVVKENDSYLPPSQFGQLGYEFHEPSPVPVNRKGSDLAPLQTMDFINNSEKERGRINDWVKTQTHNRICDLIPSGALNCDTRLVLVNAIYLKASWYEPFHSENTKPLPFHVKGGDPVNVPTMSREGLMGYAKREGYQVISVAYGIGRLHLLILLPDTKDGLPALEAKLTPEMLRSFTDVKGRELELHLPKFKLEPPVLKLGKVLSSLGMTSAFDEPKGSANFDRMAPHKSDDYLRISEVFHKTFLALEEKGTEATAATVIHFGTGGVDSDPPKLKPKPLEVRVDRPFLFAIQNARSGACLFMGRVTDPR